MEEERLQASQEFAIGSMERQKEVTEDSLKKDPAFIEAYKHVNKYLNPDIELDGNDEDLASQAFQMVSDIKNPIYTLDDGLGLAGTYMKFKDAPEDVKKSLWYMWDNYDEADMTFAALGRGLKSIGKDPSTYTGIGAGFKFFGQKAAGSLATKRLKEMLLSSAVTGAYTGGEEFVKQEVQDVEKDYAKIREMASIGAVIGVVAPPVIEGVVKGVGAGAKATGKYIADTIQEGEELMMQQAGGGTPPVMPTRKQGENLIAYAKRKERFYAQYPELKPKIKPQKEIVKPNKLDIDMKFDTLTSYENYTEGMKNTIIEKPFNTPKVKIYRGESENSGQGASMFGSGLYTTTNKNLAKKYGKVREVSKEELPNNPIQFKNELDFRQFEYELSKELGIDKRDMVEYIGEIDEYLKNMGYDGMSVGTGKDAFFVTFPQGDK